MNSCQLPQKQSNIHSIRYKWASLVTQIIKNPPAMPETRVQSLGWEDPLEKGMATYSSILAWRISMDKWPGRLQSMTRKESYMSE